ncbi:hypothetical protein JYU07_00225 [Roseiflexus sp. AH-315-K22]|nr:hypothetical protein [Roseiflexus sp. AH-315-K22]
MASTHVQLEVEEWVRRKWLPRHYGVKFARGCVELSSGALFDFNAVSSDSEIVASISTSALRSAGGKLGAGKMEKIRSDAYFLVLAEVGTKALVFSEKEMYERWITEQEQGRVPSSIDVLWARIPPGLNKRLVAAREIASKEVRLK